MNINRNIILFFKLNRGKMDKKELLKRTKEYVKTIMADESSGHDWYHIERVLNNAELIMKTELADSFIINMTILLHDLDDWKFIKKEDELCLKSRQWLIDNNVCETDTDHILDIIKKMSFKGTEKLNILTTIEGKIVQDADRLDALGAIGIARAFATGATRKRMIYDPSKKLEHSVFDFTKQDSYSTLHHFYDKILLVQDLLNTKTAKKIAQKRHEFIEQFLSEFLAEWNGEK
jgi:uncharacterized protein